jgi:hypothetical protein
MNALRHGLRAATIVLPAEKPEDFHQLCNDLETEWQPQSRTEHFYLEQMAVSQWKLARVEIAEKSILEQKFSAKSQIPLVEKLWQCQHRLERSYTRAQRELERWGSTRDVTVRLQDFRRRQVHQPEQSAPQPVAEAPAAPQPQPTGKAPYVMSAPAPASEAPSAAPSPRIEWVRRTAS